MDLNILIAALGLLTAGLAEMRATRRDLKRDQLRPFGISLLQLMLVLDKIIDTGEELIRILANIPLGKVEEKTMWAVLRDKRRLILPLIKQQERNLEVFAKIYQTPLGFTGSKVTLTLGDTIKMMVPGKTREETRLVSGKKGSLRLAKKVIVLSWILEHESAFESLIRPVNQALGILVDSLEIDEEVGHLSLHLPTKVKFQGPSVEVEETADYDLTKQSDLRRLLGKSRSQLNEIRELREQLAQIIRESFSLEDLLQPR